MKTVTYTKRVQAVLTQEQYKLLLQLAREQKKPISVLIREAIEREYCQKALVEQRRQALQGLLALEAPIADWEQMEAEITQGALEKSSPS